MNQERGPGASGIAHTARGNDLADQPSYKAPHPTGQTLLVAPFRPVARRQSATPPRGAGRRRSARWRRMDRAAAVTTAVLQVVNCALRMRYRDDDGSAIACARPEIESLLRDELADAKREALDEIRLPQDG